MVNWQELENKYYMHTFSRMPVTLVRGQGVRVWDDNGKEYLDFINGLAVNVLGHCHPVVTEAITRQAATLLQTSNLVFTTPQLQLAEFLANHSCFDHAFFCNSGGEANEGAVKLARRWGKLKVNGAFKVITAFNSFHGRTLAMTAATGQHKLQEPYEPLPEGFINVPFNDIQAIKQATGKDVCAVMLEPIQGEGGVNVPGETYFPAVREWCDQNGILLIFDEVQTGMGRLGKLFGYQLTGIEPDIATLAKGMANGVPIGAVLAKKNADVFMPGEHGSTFGGNPLACAASYATFNYLIENRIPDKVIETGEYFKNGLNRLKEKFAFVTEVRGRGLLLAMEFENEIAQDLMISCLQKGILVNKVKPSALRFLPPLIAGKKEVDEALSILDKVLTEANI